MRGSIFNRGHITKWKLCCLALWMRLWVWMYAIYVAVTLVIVIISKFIDLPTAGISDGGVHSILGASLTAAIGISFLWISFFLMFTLRGMLHIRRQELTLGFCFNEEMKNHSICSLHKKHWKSEMGWIYQDENWFIAIMLFRVVVF